MSDYNDMAMAANSPIVCREVSQRQRLEEKKKYLNDQIKDIDRALELFDKNPEIEELTNLLRRI